MQMDKCSRDQRGAVAHPLRDQTRDIQAADISSKRPVAKIVQRHYGRGSFEWKIEKEEEQKKNYRKKLNPAK